MVYGVYDKEDTGVGLAFVFVCSWVEFHGVGLLLLAFPLLMVDYGIRFIYWLRLKIKLAANHGHAASVTSIGKM